MDIQTDTTMLPPPIHAARLLVLFLPWFAILGLQPWYRQDWLLENALVVVFIALLVKNASSLRFSDRSYTLAFVFLCIHEIGAHYTYSEVPYQDWFLRISGQDFQSVFGTSRNHFDRLVHFLFGLLLMPMARELVQARAAPTGLWSGLLPLALMLALSGLYELIEWQAAVWFGGDLGQAYVGTQGDVWDAQKDTAFAGLGALLGQLLPRTEALTLPPGQAPASHRTHRPLG